MHERIGGVVLMRGDRPGMKIGVSICGARRSVHEEGRPIASLVATCKSRILL